MRLLESILQPYICGMSVDFGFTTESIEHVVPVDAHVPMFAKLLIDGQAAIHRCAECLTVWRFLGVIYHLQAYLPCIREIGSGSNA